MKNIAIFLIDIYKSFSFMLYPGGACRYSPTCSEYMRNVISRSGVIKGLQLGVRRLLSCR